MTDRKEELISVIVPVYNVEDFVEECLHSIASQTYGSLEVIIIDDGSADRSGLICERYAERHTNMRVFHQTNQGLSAARNAGMDLAHGEWYVFVDGDDYIHPDMIRVLYDTAVKENVKLVRCDYQHTYDGISDIRWHVPQDPAAIPIRQVQPSKEMRNILEETTMSFVWGAIYLRSVVSDLRFIVDRNYEDVVFMTEVLGKIDTLYRVDVPYCAYRHVKESITRSPLSGKMLDFCIMMKKRIRLIRDFFPELQYLAEYRFWSKTINLYNGFLSSGKRTEAGILLRQVRTDYLPELLPFKALFSKDLPVSARLMMLGCRISFQTTCAIKKRAIWLMEKRYKSKH